jgi:hypothetical protein
MQGMALMTLVEENLGPQSIQAVAWIWLAALSQIYSENLE